MASLRPTRLSTPPPQHMNAKESDIAMPPPHSTPGRHTSDGLIGAQRATVPPSPGFSVLAGSGTSAFADPLEPVSPARSSSRKTEDKRNVVTEGGIKKPSPKKKTTAAVVVKGLDAASKQMAVPHARAQQNHFRFLGLPGEIRNLIYQYTYDSPKQALLVHRPRLASLRPRTRLDRARTLKSDVIGQEHDIAVSEISHRISASNSSNVTCRESNRPFAGLTQVCRQLRDEFRPIYLSNQEVGMDLTATVKYLQTFYYDAPAKFAALATPGGRTQDMPYNGNLTIAVGDRLNKLESRSEGVEILMLLDIWANSFKIEAGFGRYLRLNYSPETDGEAKDLYRLFGRRVLRNRNCSGMNVIWRTTLRTRSLASVRIHRNPPKRTLQPTVPLLHWVVTQLVTQPLPLQSVKPYFHIIFKKECAEPWMTKFESDIPKTPRNWLADRGFNGMEHFDVRVGVEI